MNEYLLQKAMALFDTPEKWNAFLELVNNNDNIQNRWWKKLQTEVYQRENQIEVKQSYPKWEIYKKGNSELRWYLKNHGENSLVIYFSQTEFGLYYLYGYLDKEKVSNLLKDSKYDIFKYCYNHIPEIRDGYIGQETKIFSFGVDFSGDFSDMRVRAWYAGNETSKFADALIKVVRKFQTPEITASFEEINEKCKKQE